MSPGRAETSVTQWHRSWHGGSCWPLIGCQDPAQPLIGPIRPLATPALTRVELNVFLPLSFDTGMLIPAPVPTNRSPVQQLYKTRQHFVCTPELSTETLESSDDWVTSCQSYLLHWAEENFYKRKTRSCSLLSLLWTTVILLSCCILRFS